MRASRWSITTQNTNNTAFPLGTRKPDAQVAGIRSDQRAARPLVLRKQHHHESIIGTYGLSRMSASTAPKRQTSFVVLKPILPSSFNPHLFSSWVSNSLLTKLTSQLFLPFF